MIDQKKYKIKVLVVLPGLLPPVTKMAGLRIIYELYKRVNRGENVEIYVLASIFKFVDKDYLSWIEKQKIEENLRFFVINDRVYENTIFEFLRSKVWFIFRTWQLNRKYNFDIIHEYSSAPIIFFLSFFYKKILRKTVFHTLCTSNKGRLASFKFNWGIRYVDKVICASRYITDELKKRVSKKYRARILYLTLGVDVEKFQNIRADNSLRERFKVSKSQKVVLFVGPLEERKGAVILAKAANKVLAETKDVVFIFAAYGKNGLDPHHIDNRKRFLEMISRNSSNIHLVEGMFDIPSLMASADIFVLPPVTSHGILAQPLTLLEAMSLEKPVIASAIDGVEEIIKEGSNGLLFKNKDSDGLADKICSLLADDSLRLQLAKKARKDIFENYDVNDSSKHLIRLYEKNSR